MNQTDWYQQLVQPFFAPPAWLFGPVWSILYAGIAVSFGFVFYQIFKKALPPKIAIPFLVNLVSNATFTPLQFGLKNNELALLDIIVVLGSIIWCMKSIYPHYKWVAYAQIPYLLWVSFATILQASITYLNF